MCGFTGFFGAGPIGEESFNTQVLHKMTDAISHRGPDSEGQWTDNDAGIALGHRRLAIVDLTVAGAQPMTSSSGRYVIAFNGEIYNHMDCRAALANASWRGHSDTETLLAGFDTWGIASTVARCIGMFAFAVWDKATRTLTLVRDRLGEKPLYYGWQGSGRAAVFLFGSELKALRAHPAFVAQIDRDGLCSYMRHNNVGGAHSIYQGVHKLLPGSLLTVSRQALTPVVKTYWSGAAAATQGVAQPFAGSTGEAVDALELLLKDAVRQQMMADVPLGAFLSGGVDSSTVVALMQAQSSRPIKTFTIGFNDELYNEAAYAKAVAQHLGTEHTELYVTPEQALAVIAHLPTLYDEPFADSSQIPTFLVSQLARQQVAVSLSGDAGDELFCGYNRYRITDSYWPKLSAIPLPMRRVLGCGLTQMSPHNLNRLAAFTSTSKHWANIGEKLHKAANVMTATTVADLYQRMISQWDDPAKVVVGGTEPATLLTWLQPELTGLSDVERMMALDMLTYLPDDILTKVDRAAMGVSLETRVPFLDHRVVEFAWSLPQSLKLRNGVGKWVLRQVLYRHVPNELIERPKMGFSLPIGDWLRGPLRDWAEDLLDEARLRQEGYFHPTPIRQKWAEHLSGARNWESHLWNVLMFQAWLQETVRPD
jgi:asparagine synthase (glutamine-hydrolysing)